MMVLPETLSSGRGGEMDGYVSLCQVGFADGRGGFIIARLVSLLVSI